MRHLIRFRTLGALATLAVLGCGGDELVGPRPPVNLAFATIFQGSYWGCSECDSSRATAILIENDVSWREFLEAPRDVAESSAAPFVDFENWVVLALLDEAEQEMSWIEIDSVRRESDRMRINRRVAPVDLYVVDGSCH